MLIKKNITKEELNGFLKKQKHSEFLQSWEWGEFQTAAGNKIIRLCLEENSELVCVATLIKKKIALGMNYFYCPHGPIMNFAASAGGLELVFNFLMDEVGVLAKIEKVIFFRFEPLCKIKNSKYKICQTIDVQPSKTLILDITKTEEELLRRMHPKTRYNIRLAEKKGVEVQSITHQNEALFENFWKIMQETNQRDGFRLHGKEYYQKMLNLDFIKLIGGFNEDRLIAANILAIFGDTAVYMHGASANEQRNLMAPYALQWQSIRNAKAQKCKYYDFFGIDEMKWPGVTRFKKGFDGEEVNYPGTFDVVFDLPWYKMYNGLRWIRRKM